MANTSAEMRSILNALKTFLTGRGWTGITYTDGYQPDTEITKPHVAVNVSPSRIEEIQLGRDDEKLYNRVVVLNAYMTTERQASDIADDMMEFLDLECVTILDHLGNTLGVTQVTDTTSIRAEVFPPIMNMPKVLQWRGAAQGIFQAWYF